MSSSAQSTGGDLLQAYVHKTVALRKRDANLEFLTSQSLFSSNAIDVGTNLLIRAIGKYAKRKFATCLDLGCGYGPLGIYLATSGIAASVEMVDRDALAVEFAAVNADENGVTSASARASLGLDDVASDSYDLIVSNLPGKAGSDVLRHLLRAACRRLGDGGQFWGVIVEPLWLEVAETFSSLDLDTLGVEQGSRHVAFGFARTREETDEPRSHSIRDVYGRGSVDFTVDGRSYVVETSRGLPEFDGLSYSTQLLLEHLSTLRNRRWRNVVALNVGQGYVPLALRASGMAGSIRMVDRDLLALRTAELNLRTNRLSSDGDQLHHQVGWLPPEPASASVDLVVGALRGDEPRAAIELETEATFNQLPAGGVAVIAGESTPVTRMLKSIEDRKDVQLLDRSRYRGQSVMSLQKRG